MSFAVSDRHSRATRAEVPDVFGGDRSAPRRLEGFGAASHSGKRSPRAADGVTARDVRFRGMTAAA